MGLHRTRSKPVVLQNRISPHAIFGTRAMSPLAMAVAAVLYPASATYAQTSADDSIEEIVVTATRREVRPAASAPERHRDLH